MRQHRFCLVELLIVLFLLGKLITVSAFTGVIEGDTSVELYVNGVYMRPDTSVPLLPMNILRMVAPGDSNNIFAVTTANPLQVGDLIAVEVRNTNPVNISWTEFDGSLTPKVTFPGFHAAFDDGTMTSREWNCTTQDFVDFMKPSHNFDASVWYSASEDPVSCCPWRDPKRYWEALNSRWISVPNASDGEWDSPRRVFCRYRVPGNRSRLFSDETAGMTTDAPSVTITKVSMGNSLAEVFFTTNMQAKVTCGVVDPRYNLRAPTPKELMAWGESVTVAPTSLQWFTLATNSVYGTSTLTPISSLTAGTINECMTKCTDNALCNAITWFQIGMDFTTGANCKLLVDINETWLDTTPAQLQVMTYMYLRVALAEHSVSIAGMLTPGTLYLAYCSAEVVEVVDEVLSFTGLHSTWESVQATKIIGRSEGCLDCGSRTPPVFFLFGGWSSDTEISLIVTADREGRLYCAARPATAAMYNTTYSSILINGTTISKFNPRSVAPMKPEEIANTNLGASTILLAAGSNTKLTIRRLTHMTWYEVYCTAEADGGIFSNSSTIMSTRRVIRTVAVPSTIADMSVRQLESETAFALDFLVDVAVLYRGYVWCMPVPTVFSYNTTIPTNDTIKRLGSRIQVEDARIVGNGVFRALPDNATYEIFCVGEADDFSNTEVVGSGMQNPFPVTTVLKLSVDLNNVRLSLFVDGGPARITCVALRWRTRPSTLRPQAPIAADFLNPNIDFVRFNHPGYGPLYLNLGIEGLVTGSLFDLYCYSSILSDGRKGMTKEMILRTRTTFKTGGPVYMDAGFHCIAGKQCVIFGLQGDAMSSRDRVLVRTDRCPGPCQCTGEEDQWHKGARCSLVYQGGSVAAPAPGTELDPKQVDKLDPVGAWCYVQAGACDDQIESAFVGGMFISYTACSYNQTIGRPGSGPLGFPRGGVGLAATSAGDSFEWGSEPVYAAGDAYNVCWCNGTSSSCELVGDFKLPVGTLFLSGPSAQQLVSDSECIAGMPCQMRMQGVALFDNSRLAVLPLTPMGCEWRRESPFELNGVPGFPQVGVSSNATEFGRVYSWGGEPVLSSGGTYILCWCGAVPADPPSHRRRSNRPSTDLRTERIDCPPQRGYGGASYLAPAGTLSIVGPKTFNVACSVGTECIFTDIPGHGLQPGDKVAILRTCGEITLPPPGWFDGDSEGDIPAGWLKGGWLLYAAERPEKELLDMGAPVQAVRNALSNGTLLVQRGVWGFPNRGISAGPSQGIISPAGTYRWGSPQWAFSGEYRICWCGGSHNTPCYLPLHFIIDVGAIIVSGPAVLPGSQQCFQCVRGQQCSVDSLLGEIPRSSQIFISSGLCGISSAPIGAPNKGFSLPSSDGKTYSWGRDPMTSRPGKYRICYCPSTGRCDQPEDYMVFAAVLRLKGILSPFQFWLCYLDLPCNISGVRGEALNDRDHAWLLTACGSGVPSEYLGNNGKALMTTNLGSAADPNLLFALPPSSKSGRFQVCYCPAESFCNRPEDFFVNVGEVDIVGPNSAVVYSCYEWRPCSIDLTGFDIRTGDRLRVAPGGTNCFTQNRAQTPAPVEGWPLQGVSQVATNTNHYTWGAEDTKLNFVRSKPGMYTLCWCSSWQRGIEQQVEDLVDSVVSRSENVTQSCDSNGPFDVPAGFIRLGTYQEYQYLTRDPDPAPRNNDMLYVLCVAIPLPLLVIVSLFVTWRKPRVGHEPPPLFKVREAWAAATQENGILSVMQTRLGVLDKIKASMKEIKKEPDSNESSTNDELESDEGNQLQVKRGMSSLEDEFAKVKGKQLKIRDELTDVAAERLKAMMASRDMAQKRALQSRELAKIEPPRAEFAIADGASKRARELANLIAKASAYAPGVKPVECAIEDSKRPPSDGADDDDREDDGDYCDEEKERDGDDCSASRTPEDSSLRSGGSLYDKLDL